MNGKEECALGWATRIYVCFHKELLRLWSPAGDPVLGPRGHTSILHLQEASLAQDAPHNLMPVLGVLSA